ncbi:MAG: hypothetical protein WC254_06295, partial [Candidatus Woesearchaeota archaeon]
MKKMFIILSIMIVLFLSTITSAFAGSAYFETKNILVTLVNQEPYPAAAGELVTVRVGIENWESDVVVDQVIELVPEYPFEKVP